MNDDDTKLVPKRCENCTFWRKRGTGLIGNGTVRAIGDCCAPLPDAAANVPLRQMARDEGWSCPAFRAN